MKQFLKGKEGWDPEYMGRTRLYFLFIYFKFLFVSFLFVSFFTHKFIYLFTYFWLLWVFVAVRGLSLVVVRGSYSSLQCAGFSLRGLLIAVTSLVAEHRL